MCRCNYTGYIRFILLGVLSACDDLRFSVVQQSCPVTSVEIVESSICMLLWKTIWNWVFVLSQAQLIPALSSPQVFRMWKAPPNGVLLGFRCTNKQCLRVFDSTTKLRKHQVHRSQRGKPCADMNGGEAMFQVPENGPNLQPARIVACRLHPCKQLTHRAWKFLTVTLRKLYAYKQMTDRKSVV